MTDIVKKKTDGRGLAAWHPFQALRELFRWDAFREPPPASPLPFRAYSVLDREEFSPRFDVTEQNDAYVFRADVPGVKQEDLEISTIGNRLQIRGKRDAEREERSETAYSYEREFGSFLRSFALPDSADVEHARSQLTDGVLTLVIPKRPGAQSVKIPISTSSAKS